MTQATIMARAASIIVHVMQARGLDVSSVSSLLDVELSELDDPEQRVDLARFYALLEHLAAQVDTPHWALDVVGDWEVDLFDVLGYLIYTSASVGQSFQRFVAYRALWSDGEDFWLEPRDAQVDVCWRAMGPARVAHHHLCDMIAADVILGTERLLGRTLGVEAIHFCYPKPKDLSAHRMLFGVGPVFVFDASMLRIILPSSALDLAMPHSDEMMHRYFERAARARVASLNPTSESHRHMASVWIKRDLSSGHMPSMSRIASRLGASPRTLQRWLNEDGTSFRELCDEVREDLAKVYLSQGLSTKECSWLLGFSEPRAFQRAFKRWTSSTPRQWVLHDVVR